MSTSYRLIALFDRWSYNHWSGINHDDPDLRCPGDGPDTHEHVLNATFDHDPTVAEVRRALQASDELLANDDGKYALACEASWVECGPDRTRGRTDWLPWPSKLPSPPKGPSDDAGFRRRLPLGDRRTEERWLGTRYSELAATGGMYLSYSQLSHARKEAARNESRLWYLVRMSAKATPHLVPPSPSRTAFADFRQAFKAGPPRVAPRNIGECIQMAAAHGLRLVNQPQAEPHVVEGAPTNDQDAKHNRYLWAVGVTDVPYALEGCSFGQTLPTGMIKHTNLTGGQDAHCGGEAWFIADDVVVINGRSGRYGPTNEEQLQAAGLALKQCGYKVAIIGFDETNLPAAIVVGQEDLEWL